MDVVEKYPPNIDLIRLVLNPPPEAVFAFGGAVYNPSGAKLLPDVLHHESIHQKQQGYDPDGWWQRYLQDEDFRLSQELEAYREQYLFAKENGIKGKLLEWALDNMAMALFNDYKLGISYGEAKSKIRSKIRQV